MIEKFLAEHLVGDAKAERRVDFYKVNGIPDRVENPYLFPPWAFTTSPDGATITLSSPPKKPPPKNGRRRSAGPAQDNKDAEFVSGMSEARQKEVEAGIGTLFGAGKKGK